VRQPIVIDEADDLVVKWAESVVQGPEVALERPEEAASGRGVSVHLVGLAESPLPRDLRAPPLLQMSLRYLVTTWAEDVRTAHKLLGDLVFAAMEQADFEVDLEPLPHAYWDALGVSPRPHLVLRVPLRKQLERPATKLIEKPLVVYAAPVMKLEGTVVGAGEIPIADALIGLPGLQRFTRSDGQGHFSFDGVPAAPPVRSLSIRAKGREFSTTRDPATGGRPMVIKLDFVEA
jgi:hypothetical protein